MSVSFWFGVCIRAVPPAGALIVSIAVLWTDTLEEFGSVGLFSLSLFLLSPFALAI